MSPQAEFKMFFDDREATTDELSHVEDISVEQAVNMASEATIRISVCLRDDGQWSHVEDDATVVHARIRVEVQPGSGQWTPLIDGPIVARASDLESQPGRSVLTLTVADDSALLNAQDEVEVKADTPPGALAKALFQRVPSIAEYRIEEPPSSPPNPSPLVRRGTAMSQIRALAQRHGSHAFVLPAPSPGQSIGCFLNDPDPTVPSPFPDLVLLGSNANLATLKVTEETRSPTSFMASTLSLRSKQVVSRTSSSQNLALLGPKPALSPNNAQVKQLSPNEANDDDPDAAVQAAARLASHVFKASGRLLPGKYPAVLSPHHIVSIRAGATGLSGKYILTKVLHHITPSLYSQSFEAKRNASENVGGADPSTPIA